MADFKDVGDALVTAIAGIVYPSGIGFPSVTGVPVRIFQGWPSPQQLDIDIAAGTAQVSVWPTPNETIAPGVLSLDYAQVAATITPTLTATIAGQTVTIAGTVSTPQNVALVIDAAAYAYAVLVADTLASIAAALAALAGATSAGAVITLPASAKHITARTGTTGQVIRETRRVERIFQITVWASAQDKRDPLASAIDSALSSIFRLVLPDGSSGTLRYKGATQHDELQKQAIFRRDIMYAVEYSATQTLTATQITANQSNFSVQADGLPPAPIITTIFL